jgi:DNA end-binding protein Ku
MAARPYWKGYLRLSLVSLGVHLYNATESKAEISFRQIHKPSGKRVIYTKTVAGVGKIENDDIVKGFEVGDDTYVTFERDELEALRLESSKTIDLVRFVDASEIDYRFFEKPYFLVPADEHSAEAFAVVREALRKSGKVGLAQLATHGREHLVAVAPLEEGMVVEVLRYADELREPKCLYDDFDSKPPKDMVDLATQIIEKKSGPFKPGDFEDHYGEAVRDLVARKRKGQKLVAAEEPAQEKGQVIDVMDALSRRMG